MSMMDQIKWLCGRTSSESQDLNDCGLAEAAEQLQAISQEIIEASETKKAEMREALITQLNPASHDEFLDRTVALVCTSLGVPVSMVNLIGIDTQYSAAVQGNFPRSVGFNYSSCHRVVLQEQPMVVIDAQNDHRVCDQLHVVEMGVQAYLGLPLIMNNKLCVGAVCAMHMQPHVWSPQDISILEGLRDLVVMLLELRQQVNEIHAHALQGLTVDK